MRHLACLMALASACCGRPTETIADDDGGYAEAPKDSAALETTFEGTYFVRKGLKRQFDRLLSEVSALEGRVRRKELKPEEAREELADLRDELMKVQRLINDQKVLVSAFKIHRQTEEGTFELGPQRLLVVTSDKVHLVGWDKPHVKYELERIVLAGHDATKESVEGHIKGVQLKHDHKPVPEFVGQSKAERLAYEKKYLASPDGQKLTAEQRATRQKFVDRIANDYKPFEAFQGRDIDSLTLEGLVHQEGNRQIQYEVIGPDGKSVGSRWRRHAKLTLYVPKCQSVLVRGCQQGIDISGLDAHLILTSYGSRDRDYNGKFELRGHRGRLTLMNVPIDIITDVEGGVEIHATTEMANTGNNHRGGFRTAYTPAARACEVSNVRGDLLAHFVRSNLTLRNISGSVNVQNEFGDTHFSINEPIAKKTHRILSLAGKVRVELAKNLELGVPLFAATNCGTNRTNMSRRELDDLSVTHTSENDGTRRNWRAYHTPVPQGDFAKRFELMGRPDQILFDQERSNGLDLMSQGGRVEIVRLD